MTTAVDGPIALSDVLRIFARQRRKMCIVIAVTLLATYAWIRWAPRTYESEAKLFVRMGRANVSLDPTATTGQTMNLYQTHDNEINSALQILDSRQVAAQVVDAIGPELILADKSAPPAAQAKPNAAMGLLNQVRELVLRREPESERNQAIRQLQTRASVWAPINSSVMVVQCRSGDPHLAQRLAQTWSDAFFQEYVRATRTEGSYEFFAQQADDLQEELAAAERCLREAKDRANVASIGGQQEIRERQASAIERELEANRAACEAAKAKIASLENRLASMSAEIVTQEAVGLAHQAWDLMREKLYALEIRESELESTTTDEHPNLISVRQQRAEMEEILRKQSETRSQETRGPNPTYQALQRALHVEQAGLAALVAAAEVLQRQWEEAQESLREMNRHAEILADLERRVAILDGKYRTHAERTEQARIHEALDQQHISSVNLLQPAPLVEKPISPNKIYCLAVGLFVAFAGSVLVALASEYFDPPLRTPRQIESELQLPVLVTLPRMMAAESGGR